MYEGTVVGLHRVGEDSRSHGVEGLRESGVILSFVHIGVCGAVDDDPHVVVSHHLFHSLGVGYVKLRHIREYVVVV